MNYDGPNPNDEDLLAPIPPFTPRDGCTAPRCSGCGGCNDGSGSCGCPCGPCRICNPDIRLQDAVPGMTALWFVFATPPRKPGQRNNRVWRYVVLASSALEARSIVIEDNPQHDKSTAYSERLAETKVLSLGVYFD